MDSKASLSSLTLVLAGLIACFVVAELKATATNPITGDPDSFFGMTNLYTFHLTIATNQWAIMEESDELKGDINHSASEPGRHPSERLPMNDRPGPGPGEMGPKMPGEFKKGTAMLEFQGQAYGEIQVRFKGHSSFRFAANSLKRSFKLDFNNQEKHRTFFGLTKLNLNNNAMDPSQIREALAYHIFRSARVPAGRTAFAKVFITIPGIHDHAYAGLYTIVEQVDERFLKAHFGTKDGMLLKPEQLVGLPYFGNNWADYTNRVFPKTATKASDSNRFIEFVRCLNQTDDTLFQASIAEYVDVDEFLRFLALECLLSNMDSPLMTGHNYYLYLHPKTRKLIWLPWDMNEAFGGFGPAGNAAEQMNLSLNQPFMRMNRLGERLIQMPGIKEQYHEIVRGLLSTNFNATVLFPLIDSMAATIRSSLANDPMVSLPQFEGPLSELSQSEILPGANTIHTEIHDAGPRHSRPALKAFINQRVASAMLQLAGKTNGFMPREMMSGPNNGPRSGGPPLRAIK